MSEPSNPSDMAREDLTFLRSYLNKSSRKLAPDEIMESLLTSLALKVRRSAS